MPLGAYFGSTKITQGAGGLGQGPLQAYADGVVGGSAASAEMPGPLFAYSDGSLGLGQGPLQAYSDGVFGGSPDESAMPGPLFAYSDGSLGLGDASAGSLFAYADGVVGGSPADASMPGPLRSYNDGSLGDTDEAGGTPISVYNQGILGPHYEGMNTFGPLRAFNDGSLGAGAPAAVTGMTLDLGDAATLAEVKSLMALSSGDYALSQTAQATYTPDFYTSGIWEPAASVLWQYIVSASPLFSSKAVSASAGAQTYPNSTGLGIMIDTMVNVFAGGGADFVKKSMPNLYAWFAGGGGPVLAPYLTLADKTKGARGDTAGAAAPMMSTMAMYGLGAVALLGIALVLRRKR
jgi:hypothetical protein